MESNKTILIIDDEIDLCHLLKEYFVRRNFDVGIAYTLGDGMLQLTAHQPNILLLDYNLSDGIGWREAPIIAKMYPDTFIVLISAFSAAPPLMPEGAKYSILEKPLSLKALNAYFANIN